MAENQTSHCCHCNSQLAVTFVYDLRNNITYAIEICPPCLIDEHTPTSQGEPAQPLKSVTIQFLERKEPQWN